MSLPEELFLFPSGYTGQFPPARYLPMTVGHLLRERRVRMGIHGVSLQGQLECFPRAHSYVVKLIVLQLKDPHARSFSHVELRDAMMQTLEFINGLLKQAGVVSTPSPPTRGALRQGLQGGRRHS